MQPGDSGPDFDGIVLESSDFDLETLKRLPGYEQRRYPDAVFLGQIV